jgi:hypothetical protein
MTDINNEILKQYDRLIKEYSHNESELSEYDKGYLQSLIDVRKNLFVQFKVRQYLDPFIEGICKAQSNFSQEELLNSKHYIKIVLERYGIIERTYINEKSENKTNNE